MDSNIADYFNAITGRASYRTIAARSGLTPATLTRQINGTSALTMDTVIRVCRAYRAPLLPAFVAAGWITREEAEREGSGGHALTEASDEDLLREILRRVEAGNPGILTTPLTDTGAVVTPLRLSEADELRYAADTSPEYEEPDDA